MKIKNIKLEMVSIPLKKPFITSLRVVNSVEDVIVKIFTDEGNVGYGEAAPTAVITGDTRGAIIGAFEEVLKGAFVGRRIEDFDDNMQLLQRCIINNSSAKAAMDMALYDLYGQLYKAPLYKLLGGARNKISTDITISINEPEKMSLDSTEAVALGYEILKVKVGKDINKDIERIKAIRAAVGNKIGLRIDANQGWKPKEAVAVIHKLEDLDLNIEFIEQPVNAFDLEGLKYVTDNVVTPIMADESVFSARDAVEIMQQRAADFINIKLMKTGGIYNALRICSLAEIYGIECMIGCMLEGKISVTAAAHIAGAKNIITKFDLDGPSLCKEDVTEGGAVFNGHEIILNEDFGLGINHVG